MPPAGVTAAAARLGDAAQVGDFFLAAGFELAHHVLKRHFTLRLRLSAGLPGAAGIRALGARGARLSALDKSQDDQLKAAIDYLNK